MDFYTPLLKVTSAVTIFAQRIFTIRIEGFRPVPDPKDGARVNIVSIGKRPRDFVPFNLTIEQLSSLATKQTAKASFEPLEDSLVVMHFREPGAGPPCTIVTFSPGGPQPFCSWPDVAALWGKEKCRKPRTTPPRWQRGLKGTAQLEYDYLEDLVHEWRLGCHAPIPFDDRFLRGMPMTVDELMMEVLLYVRKPPVGGASSLSSAAARAGSKKRSAVEMEADSSSDDDATEADSSSDDEAMEAYSSSDEDEARSSKRLKFSVATPTRKTGIPSSIATRSRDHRSAKAKKPPSRQGTPERTVRSAPTTTVPAVAVAVSAGIPPPPAKPFEAPVTSTPSPQASPSEKRSVAEIDSEPLVDGPQPKRVKLACSPAVRRQPARVAKTTKSSSIRVY